MAVVLIDLSVILTRRHLLPGPFFGIVPWVGGRTIRNHTLLARELAEKAERAAHAREEESGAPWRASAAASRASCTTCWPTI